MNLTLLLTLSRPITPDRVLTLQMIYTPLLITKNLVVGACKVLSSLLVPLAALSGMGPDTASFIAQRRPDLCSLFNTLFVTFLLPVAFNPVR